MAYTVQVRPYGSSGSYFNLTPYIFFEGVKWSINPIDSSDAGRTQDGKMHRALIGEWRRLDLTMKPMTFSDIHTVLDNTKGEWLDVKFTDLQTGSNTARKMYRGATLTATHKIQRGSTQYWSGMVIELIEE